MAGTTISTSGTVGVSLTAASQNPVTITETGTIDAGGSYTGAIYGQYGIVGTIINAGLLEAPDSYGILLRSGGSVTNGSTANTTARITGGSDGVKLGIHGPGTVDNFGIISSTASSQGVGVLAVGSGYVLNGSATDSAALISGYFEGVEIRHAGAVVTNFGTIAATGTSTVLGSGSFGIRLLDGGAITNGSAADTHATIVGTDFAVDIQNALGTVVNFGTIKTTGPLSRALGLQDGGSVTNNSAGYIGASDWNGIYIGGPTAAVTNLGTIKSGHDGVDIANGGTVTNGSATDKTASITGNYNGVYIAGLPASRVDNFGSIASTGLHAGLSLYLGGTVTNGSAMDTAARISGGSNGIFAGGPSTITNFGLIAGGAAAAIGLRGGGTIVNGSATDTSARIASTGLIGIGIYDINGATTITNFGTISSATVAAIRLNGGGVITNGNTADATASILGGATRGIYVEAATVTLTNFGTISGGSGVVFANGSIGATATVVNAGTIASNSGTSGTAINFGFGTDRLVVDSGAVFVGHVWGGTGANTLELARGASAGTLSGIGTQFTGFANTVVDASARWTLAGTNIVQTVTNDGTVGVDGSLDVHTAVAPGSSGVFQLENAATLEVAADSGAGSVMQFLNPAELIIDAAAQFGTNVGGPAYTGPLIEDFAAGDSILLKNVPKAGSGLDYSAATGLLQVSGGGTAATLLFQNSSLGTGSFHLTAGPSGHALITHS